MIHHVIISFFILFTSFPSDVKTAIGVHFVAIGNDKDYVVRMMGIPIFSDSFGPPEDYVIYYSYSSTVIGFDKNGKVICINR